MNPIILIKDVEIFVKKTLNKTSNLDRSKPFNNNGTEYTELYQYICNGLVLPELNNYYATMLFDHFALNHLSPIKEDSIKKIEEKIAKTIKIASGPYLFKENAPMSNNSDKTLLRRTLDAALDDGKEIVIRNAAEQLSKTVVEPLATALIIALQLEDNDSTRGKIFKFLNSDFGTKLIGFAISFGLPMLPVPDAAKPYLLEIGRELRIQGEMAVAKPVVDMVAAPMRLLLTEKVMALPLPGLGLPVKQLENEEIKSLKREKKRSAPRKKKSDPTIIIKEVSKNGEIKNVN